MTEKKTEWRDERGHILNADADGTLHYQDADHTEFAILPDDARFLLRVLPEALGMSRSHTWNGDHCDKCGTEYTCPCTCDPLNQTGGVHRHDCPCAEAECTCYEMTGGHMPGCPYGAELRVIERRQSHDRAIVAAAERFYDIQRNDGVFALEHVEEAARELLQAVEAKRGRGGEVMP